MPAPMPDAFTPIAQQFQYAAAQWFTPLFDAARWVFSTLLIVEIVQLCVTRMATNTFWFSFLMYRVFFILFFQLILLHAGTLLPATIAGFIEVGSRAGGVAQLAPNEVALRGLVLMDEMIRQFTGWGMLLHPMAAAVGVFCSLGVALSFILMAFTLLLSLIEMYICVGAGVFLLGFGAWGATAGITHRFLSYVVGVGVKLMMIYLLIGAGSTLATLWEGMIHQILPDNLTIAMAILGGAGCYGLVCWKIPSLVSSLLTGAVGFGPLESLETTVEAARIALHTAYGATNAATLMGRVLSGPRLSAPPP